MSINLTSRQTAFSLLNNILLKDKDMEASFADNKHFAELEGRDRAFVRQLVMIILRKRKLLTDATSRFMQRKLPTREKELALLFQLGAAQILYMDVPDYAAVNTTVELAKKLRKQRFTGVLNAVLKKLAKEQDAVREELESNLHFAVSGWMRSGWEKHYGEKTAHQMIRAMLQEPPLDISLKDGLDPKEWAEKLGGETINNNTIRVHKAGHIPDLKGYNDGLWWVQDIASATSVNLLNMLIDGGLQDKKVLDLCAAPGGKTAQLANMGAKVTAVDKSSHRLKRLHENMERLGLESQVEVITSDIQSYEPSQKFDIILLDAPCSATGTLRRHPDLMWKKSRKDINELADLQEEMLEYTADNLLNDNGILLYGTCSLEAKEGEEQISKFLEENKGFIRKPFTKEMLADLNIPTHALTSQGELRLLPHYMADIGGMDGFFAVALQKKLR